MTAAREHDQSLVFHIHHDPLVVVDQRVGPPLAVDPSIVHRETLLEVCRPSDLSGNERKAAEEHGGHSLSSRIGSLPHRIQRSGGCTMIDSRAAGSRGAWT